jgi:DNA-binding Lrp family transcriptional regulator
MNFSDREREILVYVQHRADLAISEVARYLGYSEASVRRSFQRLIDGNVLARRAFIDLYRLGFSKHAFFFSLSETSASARKKVLDYLLSHPQIAYVAEVGGDFRFKADICTRKQPELREFLRTFSASFGDILRDKAFAQLLEQVEMGIKCVSQRRLPVVELAMGVSDVVEVIDDADHAILMRLSEIGEQSFSDVARKLGMPLATFTYRVENLRRKKILLGFRYVINGPALGLADYFHLVYTKGLRDDTRARLFNFCRDHPDIRYFVPCIGSWDFEIGSNLLTAERVGTITDQLYEVGGDSILRIQALPLYRVNKVSNYPLSLAELAAMSEAHRKRIGRVQTQGVKPRSRQRGTRKP